MKLTNLQGGWNVDIEHAWSFHYSTNCTAVLKLNFGHVYSPIVLTINMYYEININWTVRIFFSFNKISQTSWWETLL